MKDYLALPKRGKFPMKMDKVDMPMDYKKKKKKKQKDMLGMAK